ncbi:MAG: DUF1573 domain-containing protein [Flavobacteriaceae bacterium]|nr:DUF1573 domain-containing protein [Flavobacteriaceae bacterium]
MKKLLFSTCLFICTIAFSQETVNSTAGILEFQSETIDYGTVNKNTDGNRTFTFKNTGDSPIIITSVKGSCGCTVATKPNKPIMPNETAVIGVKYDTKRVGPFSKTITVVSNASEKSKVLRIKGSITDTAQLVSN